MKLLHWLGDHLSPRSGGVARAGQLWVVSLESAYGGTRGFDAHLADCGVQRGIPQRLSTMLKDTFSARYGRVEFEVRAAKSNYTIARRAFAEGNSLRGTSQNVEVDLDRAGTVVP